jgi:two-component system, cell cycle response regulator CtrA
MVTSLSPWRILLVEDESIIRQCSTLALTGAGYLVDAVEEGQAGWEALQARSYDLLITDNQMPGLSGTDLVLRLRSARMTLPVILASGGIVPEHAAEGSQMQPVSALPKPFSSGELLAKVAEMLRPASLVPDGPGVSVRVAGESWLHWRLNE